MQTQPTDQITLFSPAFAQSEHTNLCSIAMENNLMQPQNASSPTTATKIQPTTEIPSLDATATNANTSFASAITNSDQLSSSKNHCQRQQQNDQNQNHLSNGNLIDSSIDGNSITGYENDCQTKPDFRDRPADDNNDLIDSHDLVENGDAHLAATKPNENEFPINQNEQSPAAAISTTSLNDDSNLDGDAAQWDPKQHQLSNETPSPSPSPSTVFESTTEHRGSLDIRGERRHSKSSRIIIRKFQKLDPSFLSSTPAPNVKIGQRVAYKEYYGSEFGTIRWIGRVPQICPDWTVGVEFDNAIGEGDGSLHGRRYFIAKDCFAKFLPLNQVALVDQHVGRPEPGTMISVMSAAVRPGQMISIQRVSTVHVQHCFLNAPHRKPGADILAVNTRLHCQCPNCGPCAHVIKPPRTERLVRSGKNATHMCQFSTYTCCGMESQEETLCTYTGNKISSLPPPPLSSLSNNLPPVGNSWIEGSGYLSNLQAAQRKLMPEEYKYGAAPEDALNPRHWSKTASRRGSGKRMHTRHRDSVGDADQSSIPAPSNYGTNLIAPSRSPTPMSLTQQELPTGTADVQQLPRQTPCSCCCQQSQYHQTPPPNYSSSSEMVPTDVGTDHLAIVEAGKQNQFADVPPFEPKEVEAEQENAYDQPKMAKPALHRDSIENRYLFPTDDPIDSAFEADLEDLSQARYGHCSNSRHTSRNLFKSLRSLVSCLSSQSNQSDIERNSERTFRFAENMTSNDINKSLPVVDNHQSSAHGYDRYHSPCRCPNYHSSSHSNESKEESISPEKCSNSDKSMKIKQHQGIRRQVSSSSDCGFSSGSQNSMNLQSHLSSSAFLSIEEERRLNYIYKQVVARLLNSPSITGDDLFRLKKALFEPHFGSCCLHNSATDGSKETDQIVAELIRKALSQEEPSEPERTTSSCCAARGNNNFWICNGVGHEMGRLDEMSERNHTNEAKFSSSKHHSAPRSLTGDGGSTTNESMTLSSHSESSSNAGDNSYRKGESSKVSSSQEDNFLSNGSMTLPKAFELKLTLSINSDKKDNAVDKNRVDDSQTNHQEVERCSKSNSTLNINIVSSRGEVAVKEQLDDLGRMTLLDANNSIEQSN